MQKTSVLLLVILLNTTVAYTQKNNTKSAFLIKWENSKSYLIKMATEMPSTAYAYKPTERQMSFQEQLVHIRNNMLWLSERYISSNSYKPSAKANPQSKDAVLEMLNDAFNRVKIIVSKMPLEELATEVDFFAGPKSKLQILNLIQDHVSHHRGQLIVYMNIKGIEPPRYSGW